MVILDYNRKYHKQILRGCADALCDGKVVAYPTDTSYGLAADASNLKAIKRLYQIKERGFNKPVHVIVPSIKYAKKITKWNKTAEKLTRKFWPGPLSLVLPLRVKDKGLRILSAGTGFLGIRYPKNNIALDLAKYLKKPITTTSANPPNHVGGDDTYSAEEIIGQFNKKKFQPDIIINAGKLPRRKPSTFVRINDDEVQILREGPVKEKQIKKVLTSGF